MIASFIDRAVHGVFYQRWIPEAVQAWWYVHVCLPAAAYDMPDQVTVLIDTPEDTAKRRDDEAWLRVHLPNIRQLGPATYKAIRSPRREAAADKPRTWHIK